MALPELQLIVNELSLSPKPQSSQVGRLWLLNLQRTVAQAIDRGFQNVLLVPEAFLSAPLGEGYSFSHWLDDGLVELEVRQALQSWVAWGPFLDDIYLAECQDRVEVKYGEDVGVGLGVAVIRDHAVVSMSVAPWNSDQDEVSVRVYRRDTVGGPFTEMAGAVRNLHCPDSVERRLRWVADRCCVKPRYENPGTHDPTSGAFRGGGPMTTVLPTDAEDVYKTAIPADPRDGLSSWWGLNDEGYLYRYQASWRGPEPIAHWNGTTKPASERGLEDRAIEDREVPASIRDAFPGRAR